MQKKFLEEVIISIAGKPAEPLVDLLDGKKYINEFLIAKKLNLTINQTRNILYKISDFGLVSSIRKKDKRKGWYTYFWKIEILKCLEFFRNALLKKMEQIHYQIKSRETKEFYTCDRCNIEFTEENALVHNFMCNECGEIMSRKDNAPMIREYNKHLDRLRKDLETIDEEIKIEKEKLEKGKAREMKKTESKAASLKEAKKKERAAIRKSLPKTETKKKIATKKVTKKKTSISKKKK